MSDKPTVLRGRRAMEAERLPEDHTIIARHTGHKLLIGGEPPDPIRGHTKHRQPHRGDGHPPSPTVGHPLPLMCNPDEGASLMELGRVGPLLTNETQVGLAVDPLGSGQTNNTPHSGLTGHEMGYWILD